MRFRSLRGVFHEGTDRYKEPLTVSSPERGKQVMVGSRAILRQRSLGILSPSSTWVQAIAESSPV